MTSRESRAARQRACWKRSNAKWRRAAARRRKIFRVPAPGGGPDPSAPRRRQEMRRVPVTAAQSGPFTAGAREAGIGSASAAAPQATIQQVERESRLADNLLHFARTL